MDAWEINKEEVANRKKAMIITLIINVLVLVAIMLIVVWRQPIPPIPKYGLELNLGFTDVGSSNVQTQAPPSVSEVSNVETPAPGEPSPQITESAVPIAQPENKTAQPTPSVSNNTYEAVSETPSPIKGEEQPAEAVKEAPENKEASQPVAKPAEKEA